MIEIGLERIKLQFRVWIDGWVKFKEQAADVTTLIPAPDHLHFYARDIGGISHLFYRDDAGVEHDMGGGASTNTVPPTCGVGEVLTFDGTFYSCVVDQTGGVAIPPTCSAGQVLTFDGLTYQCVQDQVSINTPLTGGSLFETLTNGDTDAPEIMSAAGDVIVCETCGGAACT